MHLHGEWGWQGVIHHLPSLPTNSSVGKAGKIRDQARIVPLNPTSPIAYDDWHRREEHRMGMVTKAASAERKKALPRLEWTREFIKSPNSVKDRLDTRLIETLSNTNARREELEAEYEKQIGLRSPELDEAVFTRL